MYLIKKEEETEGFFANFEWIGHSIVFLTLNTLFCVMFGTLIYCLLVFNCFNFFYF